MFTVYLCYGGSKSLLSCGVSMKAVSHWMLHACTVMCRPLTRRWRSQRVIWNVIVDTRHAASLSYCHLCVCVFVCVCIKSFTSAVQSLPTHCTDRSTERRYSWCEHLTVFERWESVTSINCSAQLPVMKSLILFTRWSHGNDICLTGELLRWIIVLLVHSFLNDLTQAMLRLSLLFSWWKNKKLRFLSVCRLCWEGVRHRGSIS